MDINGTSCNGSSTVSGLEVLGKTGLIISSIVICLVALFAVIGNLIILSAIIFKRRRIHLNRFKTTFTLVGSLAVADGLVGLVVMPFFTFILWNDNLMATDLLCLFEFSLDILACTSSIFHIIMMAADRYLAICKPFLHKTQPPWMTYVYVAVAWILPTLISVPPVFSNLHLTDNQEKVACSLCFSMTQNTVFRLVSTIASFYIPAIIICILYLKLFLAIKKRRIENGTRNNTQSDKNKSGEQISHAERTAAKTIGLILSCFLVSWTPFFVLNLCLLGFENAILYEMLFIAQIWSYVNSMMNPVVYYRCNKSIKESVEEMFTNIHDTHKERH